MNRQEIKLIFRRGQKLIRRCCNAATNPLGIPENAEVKFEVFVYSIPNPKIRDYFWKTQHAQMVQAHESYHRPRVRGRDGQLYSQYDMDCAMMNA